VTVASVGALQITASRGVKIVADCLIGDCRTKRYDLVVLPGGMPGAEHLRDSPDLIAILKAQKQAGGWLGGICAAPAVALASHALLEGCRATAHPAFIDRLDSGLRSPERVVVDGRCVTSRGPGTAIEFALQLVALLCGEAKAREVAAPMVLP
jgi:4-methyl-5(b-hydroxyethyl)-thiazole monophosphate biosynthesis